MVVLAKTSNKLIRIREFHIDYVGHAQLEYRVLNTRHVELRVNRLDGRGEAFLAGAGTDPEQVAFAVEGTRFLERTKLYSYIISL
jgi:hypothetical protein